MEENMPGHGITPNLASIVTLCILLSTLIMSPEASLGLWLGITRRYGAYKARIHEKKCREAREKLKKYWVIEMDKFAEAGEFETANELLGERPSAQNDMDESLDVSTEAA
jgi:hypothetical protein